MPERKTSNDLETNSLASFRHLKVRQEYEEDYVKVGGSKVRDSQHTMCFLEGVHTFQGSGRVFLLALQKWVHTGSQEQWTGLV